MLLQGLHMGCNRNNVPKRAEEINLWPKMSNVKWSDDDSVQENVMMLVHNVLATRRAQCRKTRVLDLYRPALAAGLFFILHSPIMRSQGAPVAK
jgi:hypothetical protein